MKNIILSVFCISFAFSQQELSLHPFRPHLFISVSRTPEKNFTDNTGSYATGQFSSHLTLPIMGELTRSQDGPSMSQLNLHASYMRTTPDFSFLTVQHRLYTGTAGLNGIYVSSSRNFYLLSATVGFSEDDETIKSPNLRFTASGIGSYRTSATFYWIYGASYSFVFGREALLPMGGIYWRMAPAWSMTGLLPFSLSVRYLPSRDLRFSSNFVFGGDRLGFAPRGDFLSAPERLTLRLTQLKWGFDVNAAVSQSIALHGEVALLGGRTLMIFDTAGEYIRKNVDPAVKLTLGVQWSFSETIDLLD